MTRNIYALIGSSYTIICSTINFLILIVLGAMSGIGSMTNILIWALMLAYLIWKFAISYQILYDKGNTSRLLILSLVTLCFEIPHIFYDGFIYKLTNGVEFVLFTYPSPEMVYKIGMNFTIMRAEFLLKFYPEGNILFGINIISLLLIFCFVKAQQSLKLRNANQITDDVNR